MKACTASSLEPLYNFLYTEISLQNPGGIIAWHNRQIEIPRKVKVMFDYESDGVWGACDAEPSFLLSQATSDALSYWVGWGEILSRPGNDNNDEIQQALVTEWKLYDKVGLRLSLQIMKEFSGCTVFLYLESEEPHVVEVKRDETGEVVLRNIDENENIDCGCVW